MASSGGGVFVIAEAGVNHNGDPALAKRLIDAAAQSGANAVKFQSFEAAEIATVNAPAAEYQRRNAPETRGQYEMLKALELSAHDTAELKRHAEANGLVFLSTPFDAKSIDFLCELGVTALKIGSGELTNHPLL